MQRWFGKHLVVSVGVLAMASACGGQMDEASALDTPAENPGTRVHIMKMHQPGEVSAMSAPAGAHLNYYGGPVLKNVVVTPVYWNSSTAYQSTLNGFYTGVPNSPLFDMLAQYSSIGRGKRGTPYIDTAAGGSLTDAQVQTELNRLFAAGSIPAPTANSYYPVHFPAGTSITAPDGSQSCVQFCAYHGTYVRNGVNVNYGVIPDQGGGCLGGCGNNTALSKNTTAVSSHEMVEAVTDPAVGLATDYAPPLAWYDPTNGEIGDICNGQQGTVVGGNGTTYTIQLEFSNSANNCVSQ